MKTSQILIALALFVCVANAVDVTSLFSPTASRITFEDLSEICLSESKKSSLNRYLFKQADTDGNGYLSLDEFKVIYNRLTQVLSLKSLSDATISSRFDMADNKNRDGKLSSSEFIWLMGSDLTFANSNYATMTGTPNTLNNLVNILTTAWTSAVFKNQYSLITGTLDKKNVSFEKFKVIINFLPTPCKFKLNWSDCVLQGYYRHCDADGNGIVTLDEINTVLPILLKDLKDFLATSKK